MLKNSQSFKGQDSTCYISSYDEATFCHKEYELGFDKNILFEYHFLHTILAENEYVVKCTPALITKEDMPFFPACEIKNVHIQILALDIENIGYSQDIKYLPHISRLTTNPKYIPGYSLSSHADFSEIHDLIRDIISRVVKKELKAKSITASLPKIRFQLAPTNIKVIEYNTETKSLHLVVTDLGAQIPSFIQNIIGIKEAIQKTLSDNT